MKGTGSRQCDLCSFALDQRAGLTLRAQILPILKHDGAQRTLEVDILTVEVLYPQARSPFPVYPSRVVKKDEPARSHNTSLLHKAGLTEHTSEPSMAEGSKAGAAECSLGPRWDV